MTKIHTCEALRRNDAGVLMPCTTDAICIVTAVQEGKWIDVPMCHQCWMMAHHQSSIVIHYVKPIMNEESY